MTQTISAHPYINKIKKIYAWIHEKNETAPKCAHDDLIKLSDCCLRADEEIQGWWRIYQEEGHCCCGRKKNPFSCDCDSMNDPLWEIKWRIKEFCEKFYMKVPVFR